MSDDKLYCVHCHIMVRKMAPNKMLIGKDKDKPQPDEYVHISTRSSSGDSACGRRILLSEDVESLTEAREA